MELGNMVFGNSRGNFEVPRTDDFENSIQEVIEATGGQHYDPFENEVFKINPYDWGAYCDCGFDEEIEAWWGVNPHSSDCWQKRYWAQYYKLKDDGLLFSGGTHSDPMDLWAAENGWPKDKAGVAVHCSCGRDVEIEISFKGRNHDKSCRLIQPNFLYKPTGFQLNWYKYPLRDSYMSHDLSLEEWRKMMASCVDSIIPAQRKEG